MADPDCISLGGYVTAAYDYTSTDPTILDLQKGDRVKIVRKTIKGWWEGILRGRRGWVPINYCDMIDHDNADSLPTPSDSGVKAGIARSEESLLIDNFIHRNSPFSKESFEVESRKDDRRQLRDPLNNREESDSDGFALIWKSKLQTLADLPFNCPFNNYPRHCSPSAGFTSKEDLRSHLNSVHDLGSVLTELVVDSALPCIFTDCVRSLPGQGFASKEHLQSHFNTVHLLQGTNSRLPGILEDVEEAANDRQYGCVICHPQSVYHEQMFTAEGSRNHLVSAHRMATDPKRDMPPYFFTFSNQTQADFEVQAESKKGKAKEHAQTPTSSQAPFAIPLKPTVKLPPVWKP